MRRLVKSERGLLIHIGYMKTASTYLQKAIFCNPDLGFAKIEDPQFFLNEVRNAPEHHFLPENIRAALVCQVRSAGANGLTPVLSSEGYSGYMAGEGFDGRRNMERLFKIAPDARILIVIREQNSMLLSRHNQLIKTGATMSLRDYVGMKDDPRSDRYRSQLRYDELIAAYQTAFGKDAVCVLPFELLGKKPAAFISAIANHCGRPPVRTELVPTQVINRSRSQAGKAILARTNKIIAQRERTGGENTPLFPVDKPLFKRFRSVIDSFADMAPRRLDASMLRADRQFISDQIGSYYVESNRIIQQLTDLPLAEYGYEI